MSQNNPFGDADSLLEKILGKRDTPSMMRKSLEMDLVSTIQKYQNLGLEISFIGIDVSDGIDARVTLCPDHAVNLAV
ncbi:hypothetical protein [Acinetobacter pittii]|uniref:Uncharacterized protein n=1 Tax=Acinetobacter pittii TaxID=48296 RepID=A0AAE9S887_ACIPI|nr:hypothetical protein [Acinetobacter pittii]USU94148.1 hypothetical protein MWH18_17720 [Acinetobacter pittii]